tara:strand:- start:651 stop:1007 length:357 start_codon:yes stop_codon:yes gene_type:complete
MKKSELKKRRERHKEEPRIRMRDNAKKRAKNKNLEFELHTFKDLPKVPKKCYFLGIPLKVGSSGGCDSSPSLDRIDNKKGYIKSNVQIISRKANQIKNNASFKEFEMIYKKWRNQING